MTNHKASLPKCGTVRVMVNMILCGSDPTKHFANTVAGPDSAVPRNYMLPYLSTELVFRSDPNRKWH